MRGGLLKGCFTPSVKESEFNLSHYFTPSAAFLRPRSISLMLPYCDKRKKSASHMLIKGEDRGGLRTAPDAREAEQMA